MAHTLLEATAPFLPAAVNGWLPDPQPDQIKGEIRLSSCT
jgi:hypothetical protein